MFKAAGIVIIGLSLSCGAAMASTCGSVPYNFSSGTTAVSSQVNGNFSTIYNCANSLLAPIANPSFTGNVGIGTSSPGANLDITATYPQVNFTHTTSDLWRENYHSNYLTFTFDYFNGTYWNNVLTLNNGGNVTVTAGSFGIGTATPAYTLDVEGTGGTMLNAGYTLVATGSVGATAGFALFSSSTNAYQTHFYVDGLNPSTNPTANALVMENASGGKLLDILNNGNVGIGTTSPAYLLHVGSSSASGIVAEFQNSSGACTLTPTASSMTPSCSSDARLKKDIVDAAPVLPGLMDMRVRDFTIRATGEHRTGVIAQEMLQKHSDMVHKGPDGFYKVDEPNPWKLVKAIQELKADNERLAADGLQRKASLDRDDQELGELRKENAELKIKASESDRRLDALEARVGIRNAANDNAALRPVSLTHGE